MWYFDLYKFAENLQVRTDISLIGAPHRGKLYGPNFTNVSNTE
jgi:hypothetical protein